MSDELLGQTLAQRYRFEALLGEGTFARVYRVTDLHRRAALAAKVLRSEIAHNPTLLERFHREAHVLAHLQHPNIVRYYDFLDLQGHLFFLLEYIPGQTLEAVLQSQPGPLKPNAALAYITPLASALHYAHGESVIHRDLKPANILIHDNGTVYISDFGIARLLNTTSELTMGMTVGTPYYMSPEQIQGEPVSPATDLYALGILLYRMLTGMLPFRGETPDAPGTTTAARVTYEQLNTPPTPPTMLNPRLDLAVEDVILHSLEKDPAQRFRTVNAFYDALVEAIGAPPVELGPSSADSDRPDVKLPEWSQFMAPAQPAAADEPAVDLDDDLLPASPPERIQHPIPQPATRPHLEGEINAARRTLIHQGSAGSPATLPSVRQVSAPPASPGDRVPAPPAYIAPPLAAERPSGRRWTLLLVVIAALLVAAAVCVAAIYLSQSGETPDQQAGPEQPTSSAAPPEASAVPASGTGDHGGTRIAFDSRRTGDLDLYLMNVDGSGLEQLTGTSGAERGPSWSPDGTQIAFYGAASESGNFDIYVINADGSDLRNLTNSPDADDRYPTWSPDGARLAFHSNVDGDYDICVINLDGSGMQAVTTNDADDLGPDWSPDGTRLAYHSDEWGSGYDIAVLDLATQTVHRLTSDSGNDTFPTWSPDGTRLAYNAIDARTGIVTIALLASDGTGQQTLTTAQDGNSAFPDWSPDGAQIIFQRGGDTQSAIYVMPSAGGEAHALTGSQANFLPEWEPFY